MPENTAPRCSMAAPADHILVGRGGFDEVVGIDPSASLSIWCW